MKNNPVEQVNEVLSKPAQKVAEVIETNPSMAGPAEFLKKNPWALGVGVLVLLLLVLNLLKRKR